LDEAIRCFDRILKIDESNHSAYGELGWTKYLKGNYKDAQADLEKAKSFIDDTNPSMALYEWRIGKILWEIGGKVFTYYV